MSTFDRLRKRGLEQLNRLQDAIASFEEEGGIPALRSRLEAQLAQYDQVLQQVAAQLAGGGRQAQIRLWYARLELPVGAGLAEVRRAHRELMRKYHPDRFTFDPELEQKATRLSQELNAAVDGLTRYLEGRL